MILQVGYLGGERRVGEKLGHTRVDAGAVVRLACCFFNCASAAESHDCGAPHFHVAGQPLPGCKSPANIRTRHSYGNKEGQGHMPCSANASASMRSG